jgi:hypothetical protein
MPEPVERNHIHAAPAHLAGAALPLAAERREQANGDPVYREIADRRAQLENAETLRRARAL